MKIFDFEYLFFKGLRQLRSKHGRKKLKEKVNIKKLVRFLAVAVLFSLLIFPSVGESEETSGTKASVDSVNKEAVVLLEEGAVVDEEKARDAVPPKRIPDSADIEGLTAKSVAVMDAQSGGFIYEENSEERLPPASITKVMAARVVLRNFPPDEVVRVPFNCVGLEGNNAGLEVGEEKTVKELLKFMLVFSASDATCALATHQTDLEDFVAAMNLEADFLGLNDTHFENPIGLDEEGHYSSARDLINLGKETMEYETFRELVVTPSVEVHGKVLESTNELLGKVFGIKGIKTGYTENAGECLLFSVERGGHTIYGVVMGSEDRFGEAEKITNWVFRAYRWED